MYFLHFSVSVEISHRYTNGLPLSFLYYQGPLQILLISKRKNEQNNMNTINEITLDHYPTILLVDDDIISLELYTYILVNSKKYNVLKATSALEALALMTIHKIDIVISDLKMPEMNGRELITIVQTTYKNIQCAILSVDYQSAIALSEELGIFYLFKPVDINQLFHTVEAMLLCQSIPDSIITVKQHMHFHQKLSSYNKLYFETFSRKTE